MILWLQMYKSLCHHSAICCPFPLNSNFPPKTNSCAYWDFLVSCKRAGSLWKTKFLTLKSLKLGGVNLKKLGELSLVVAVAVPFVFLFSFCACCYYCFCLAKTFEPMPYLPVQGSRPKVRFTVEWRFHTTEASESGFKAWSFLCSYVNLHTRELATFWLYDMSHCEGLQCLLSNEVSSLYCNRSMVIIIIFW